MIGYESYAVFYIFFEIELFLHTSSEPMIVYFTDAYMRHPASKLFVICEQPGDEYRRL